MKRNPWQGETMPAPQRVSDSPVVAAMKRPTTPMEIAHQWEAVFEVSPGMFVVALVCWVSDKGYVPSHEETEFGYEGALQRMVERYGRRYG